MPRLWLQAVTGRVVIPGPDQQRLVGSREQTLLVSMDTLLSGESNAQGAHQEQRLCFTNLALPRLVYLSTCANTPTGREFALCHLPQPVRMVLVPQSCPAPTNCKELCKLTDTTSYQEHSAVSHLQQLLWCVKTAACEEKTGAVGSLFKCRLCAAVLQHPSCHMLSTAPASRQDAHSQ